VRQGPGNRVAIAVDGQPLAGTVLPLFPPGVHVVQVELS
jgi:hypothetical protein